MLYRLCRLAYSCFWRFMSRILSILPKILRKILFWYDNILCRVLKWLLFVLAPLVVRTLFFVDRRFFSWESWLFQKFKIKLKIFCKKTKLNLACNFLRFFSLFVFASFSNLLSAFEVPSVFASFHPVFSWPIFFLRLRAFPWPVSKRQFYQKMHVWLKMVAVVSV